MIEDNLRAVRARIDAAARRSGRDPGEITLVAVTKDVGVDAAREAVGAGVTDVGENRVQELRRKQEALAGLDVRWHLIGTLQGNKVRHVVGRVALIHSVDSAALADAVGKRARDGGITQDVLLEVNTGGEASKHGVHPSRVSEVAHTLLDIDGLHLRGLMTVAPMGDMQAARRAFRSLRELRDSLRETAPEVRELSMGMTGDLEIAIEEGATIVRIGTAIFGSRTRGDGGDVTGSGR